MYQEETVDLYIQHLADSDWTSDCSHYYMWHTYMGDDERSEQLIKLTAEMISGNEIDATEIGNLFIELFLATIDEAATNEG